VKVNCAALPGSLIESELFGHEKGAFTGADARRIGRFEIANGGTIFLDEVGELPLDLQAKLLRVLEEGEFERVGGSHTIKVNVRVIAATNRNLDDAVRQGTFRSDLYYRLNIFPITVPPLRERREDIPMLAENFLQTYAKRYQLKCVEIGPDAMKSLVAYDWPGNVRELRNAIERSAVLADGKSLRPEDLPDEIRSAQLSQKPAETFQRSSPTKTVEAEDVLHIPYLEDFREARREFERAYIERVLAETGGNVTRAAERVGMHRQSLQQKLKDLGLTRRYVLQDEAQDSDDE
jgi:transcriptional regulator with GAF, ATPase, and Fis domain